MSMNDGDSLSRDSQPRQAAPAAGPPAGENSEKPRGSGVLEGLAARIKVFAATLFLTSRDRILAPVLPEKSRTGRALVLVIGIMTFLAGLTAGTVHLIADASAEWSRAISKEITIQIRPSQGRQIDQDVAVTADLARRVRGVESVQVFDRKETEKLLEPWLGSGLDLSELPVPRLVVLKFASARIPDLTTLKASLSERVPNAGLDDHRLWLSRLSLMADTLVIIGVVILVLVLVATALAVAFATRGALAGTAHVIDVLHLVGAEDRYIAREFQRHFLRLGWRGGLLGGIAAMGVFAIAGFAANRLGATPGAEQVELLFGRFALPLGGYVSVILIGVVVSVVTAVVSRITVFRTLRGQDQA